jgi:predicted N-acetyltransferase YhbS
MAGVVVRRAAFPEEVEAAVRVCVEAFRAFNDSVGHPEEFPGGRAACGVAAAHAGAPADMELFVAVDGGGRVVGTNSIDLRDAVAGIGPLAVSPGGWSAGVGRRLMEACLEAAAAKVCAVCSVSERVIV